MLEFLRSAQADPQFTFQSDWGGGRVSADNNAAVDFQDLLKERLSTFYGSGVAFHDVIDQIRRAPELRGRVTESGDGVVTFSRQP
jgi:hypothetical protein